MFFLPAERAKEARNEVLSHWMEPGHELQLRVSVFTLIMWFRFSFLPNSTTVFCFLWSRCCCIVVWQTNGIQCVRISPAFVFFFLKLSIICKKMKSLLTLFPCRKTKVLYTFKKSSPLKASCITQIRCHLQFKWRTSCKSCCINKRSAQSVSDIHMILTTCIKLLCT